MAVRCIQRNVRTFFAVRNWEWWRLLVSVTPLIKTTEDLLKVRNEEMVVLRQKLEKVEAERNQLKAQNTQMNYQVGKYIVFNYAKSYLCMCFITLLWSTLYNNAFYCVCTHF